MIVDENGNEWVDINPEYVYTKIPADYVCIYHKILILFADYGIDLLKDCKASCDKRNSKIIECFNMFHAAIAAKHLGQNREAELLIKYINAQIELLYNGEDNSPSIVFPVDENGELKAIVGCASVPRFQVKVEEGNLFKGEILHSTINRDLYSLGEEDKVSE